MSPVKQFQGIPADVLNKIKILDNELKEEDITVKGYCKKKWSLIEQYSPKNVVRNVKKLERSIAQNKIDIKDGYLKMLDIINIENLNSNKNITEKRVLRPRENLNIKENDSNSKLNIVDSVDNSLKSTIINNFFNKILNKDTSTSFNNTNNISFKRKSNENSPQTSKKIKLESVQNNNDLVCDICNQGFRKIILYKGHSKNSLTENVALDKLGIDQNKFKLSQFNVYDKNNHLCPFDTGLIHQNILYFSGYLTSVDDESNTKDIFIKDCLIKSWSFSRLDNSKNYFVTFTTNLAQYYLLDCSVEYTKFMENVFEKINISKIVLEFLRKHKYCKFKQLLNFKSRRNKMKITQYKLVKHAKFICDKVYDENSTYINTPSIKKLIKLSGIQFTKHKHTDRLKRYKRSRNLTKATTTDLVRQVFDSFFPDELAIKSEFKTNEKTDYSSLLSTCKTIFHEVLWLESPILIKNSHTYYNSAKVGDLIINSGDHVLLQPKFRNNNLIIARVTYLFESDEKYFHAHLFCRGENTVLGETANSFEIFQIDECENIPLGSILKKTDVEYKICNNNDKFYCHKRYDRNRGRFEDLFEDRLENDVCNVILGYKPCISCKIQQEKNKFDTAFMENDVLKWRNEIYKTGIGVYLEPGTFKFKTIFKTKEEIEIKNFDENMYPEMYRKKSDNIIGIEISEPFCIGYIQQIYKKDDSKFELKVQKLFRPENTHKGIELQQKLDINIVYWSNEQLIIPFSKVCGKCFITFADNITTSITDWSKEGPNRFYFLESYNENTKEFSPVDETGKYVGLKNCLPKWPSLSEPLKIMDVFAGCGGLSEGLHQSGVGITKWAVENETNSAKAFKQNNPKTVVYIEDCNELLSDIISGKIKTEKGQRLPKKGEVDLLVGGPPCQGFSGMNRFTEGQYSSFKNSLIVSYLSYCDFYRPKYFILENVRNFVTFNKSMVLKLTLRCLLAMGYQCTFGVLQAGNYGVPQIRRRCIILAAKPGEILPEYPEPLHVFTSKRANPLDIVIDNCRYNTGSKWLHISAPYRTVTVQDAMSDLPQIKNGCSSEYYETPISHFQREMRIDAENILKDHICKKMPPLVEARISYIPITSGSDWRDLPNIEITLSDGTKTKKLRYDYHDKRNGKNSEGKFRGVCPCASGKSCRQYSQESTLIPWCLPHTANRHNHWAGLYGRIEWNGVFNTTVTNPEPISKQGRVIHPNQNRVVSVRECARSQGFPDRFVFYGNLMDKHRQVGNAVPPPMGKAIGREILKTVMSKQ